MWRPPPPPAMVALAALLFLLFVVQSPLAACAQDTVLFDLSGVRGGATMKANLPSAQRFVAVSANSFGGPGFPSAKPGTQVSLLALPEDNAFGCEVPSLPGTIASSSLPFVLLIRRGGNCSFVQKGLNAQAARAYGMLVVASADDAGGAAFPMGAANASEAASVTLPSAMVDFATGDALIRASFHTDDSLRKGPLTQQLPISPVLVRTVYQSVFDWSFVWMGLLATFVVMYAAYIAADEERHARKQRQAGLDVVLQRSAVVASEGGVAPEYLTHYHALGFIVGASVSLVILFFFIQYLIYVLIVLFAIASLQAVTHLGARWLRWLHPSNVRTVHLPLGLGEVSLYTAISFGVGLVLVVTWVLVRNSRGAWLLQDFLGVLLLILLQQSIRLPDIKVSAILLCMAFLYDVFWVFLSGYFFRGSSVMITVARGGDTGEAVPMLLRLPRENDELGGGYSMLGLGDMALPGLLVSYLLRFDLLHLSTDPVLSSSWTYWFKNSYFVLSSLGYMAGLAFTHVVLMVTQSGQPALLYLVPTTLGLVVFVAHRRGELAEMWHGGERCSGPPTNRANGSAAVTAAGARNGTGSSSSNGIGGVLSASPRSRSPRRTGGGGGGGSYASVASHVVPPSGAEEDEELELDGDAAMVNDESQLALEDREMMNNL